MSLPSKSRRKLLISLGLLGLAGVLFQPGHKLLEVRKGTRTWTEKWQRPDKPGAAPRSQPAPEGARRVPALVEKDLTLNKADSPWIVDENVMIPAGVTLTIEAGSDVLFGRKRYLTVEGRILARGTKENPVRLRAYSGSEDDKWAGLFITDVRQPSTFRHVVFENSFYGSRLVHAAAIWTACVFQNVREVCSAFKSETVFRNCLVEYKNYPGQGNINVFKFQKGVALMEGCTIYSPDSDYKVDGIDADYLEKAVFRGNRMYGGICPGADAIDVGQGSRNILIEDNIITGFVDKGVSVGEGADVVINNNIIARCAMGIGVKDSGRVTATRSTFYENDYAVKCYEKVPGLGGGDADIDGCIIAGSRVAPFEVDEKSTVQFARTLCDQQQLPGENNVQGSPEFNVTGKGNLSCVVINRKDGVPASCSLYGASIDTSSIL